MADILRYTVVMKPRMMRNGLMRLILTSRLMLQNKSTPMQRSRPGKPRKRKYQPIRNGRTLIGRMLSGQKKLTGRKQRGLIRLCPSGLKRLLGGKKQNGQNM